MITTVTKRTPGAYEQNEQNSETEEKNYEILGVTNTKFCRRSVSMFKWWELAKQVGNPHEFYLPKKKRGLKSEKKI